MAKKKKMTKKAFYAKYGREPMYPSGDRSEWFTAWNKYFGGK
tara:strand:+ start:51 stop:176 length:126 start_codon:yes stop_codon:yes gene_type:complete